LQARPRYAEELTLRDVMNDCPIPVRLEDVLGTRFHQVGAEPAESLAENDPRRWRVVGHLRRNSVVISIRRELLVASALPVTG
jgi:hypothetical protein